MQLGQPTFAELLNNNKIIQWREEGSILCVPGVFVETAEDDSFKNRTPTRTICAVRPSYYVRCLSTETPKLLMC